MKRPLDTSLRLRRGVHILPSLFTTGNVFCGFYAFIAVFNERYYMAAWAIAVAMIFDVLDGRIARMTNTASAFGLQYDSLADVISFCMAPAFLVYAWVLRPFGRIGWMAAFLFLLCGALRLARFNVTKTTPKTNHFTGLPTPAAAATIASIVIASRTLFPSKVPPGLMVAAVYILAFLMVSNIRYPAFKHFDLKRRVTFTRFMFVILVLYIVATIPRIALLILTSSYLLAGPLGAVYLWLANKPRQQPDVDAQNPLNPDTRNT